MFDAPKLKIERAKKHITELSACVTAFFNDDRYRIIVEQNPKTGESTCRVEIQGEIPADTALIIGDALHNLRSSLDVAFYEFTGRIGGTPDSHTKFPLRKSRDELVHALAGGSIKHCARSQQLIIDSIKPYPGGNDAICALHELNIADKHQLLIPLVQVTELRGVNAKIGGIVLQDCTFSVVGGQVMNIFRSIGGDVHIYQHGQIVGEIFFNRGFPFEGKPVIPALYRIAEEVSRTVEVFERFCAS